MVLTENTAQIAMAEEHRSAAPCAADGRFFPVMLTDQSHFRQEGCTAEAKFACGAVDAAVSGADSTLRQSGFHFFHV